MKEPAPVLVLFGSIAPGLKFDLRLFHECDDAFFAEADQRLRPCLEAVTWRWARYGEGQSLKEIAQSMGINVRTAAVLARRGLDQLAGMDELAETVLADA